MERRTSDPRSLEVTTDTAVLFLNATLRLQPPSTIAEFQLIFWPLRQMSFDARSVFVAAEQECRSPRNNILD